MTTYKVAVKIYLIFIICGIFFYGNSTLAQVDETNLSTDILLSLSPVYPGPHEQVRVTAQTYSFDVNTIPLSWYVNGKLVKSSKGATVITITTGAIGTPTTIKVIANPPTLTRYEKTLTIWPSDFQVLWYTDTYTPVGYRGKALPVRGSIVTFSTLPLFVGKNGSYNPETLLYEWRVDNILQKNKSGRGEKTFSLPITKSKNVPPRVSVRVYNEDKTITQEKHLLVAVREPELIFYELHPLRGPLYQQSFGNTYKIASGGETQILAEPYYTSGRPIDLNFIWKIENTALTPTPTKHPEVLAYYTEAGSVADQNISLEIQNPFNILEQIRKSFRIHVE